MFELRQILFSTTSSSGPDHLVESQNCNQQNDDQLALDELSKMHGGIVPVFENPEDEKEWQKGFEKHCTKPSENGRYPEDCFFGFSP